MKTKTILAAAVTATFTFSTLAALAQFGPPPGSGAPIDGGAIFLVAGAAAYGYKKMKEKQKKEKQASE